MNTLIKRTNNKQTGATMVEYAIMVALIAAIAIGTVVILGGEVRDGFQDVVTALEGAEST